MGEGVWLRPGASLSRPRADEPEQQEIERPRREVAKLKAERDILKGRSLLGEGSDTKLAFVAKHRTIWPVACDALGVSRSGFHAWLNRSPSARSRSDEELGGKVKASFAASDRTMAHAGCGVTCSPTGRIVACTGLSD